VFDRRRRQIDTYFQKHTGSKITNFMNITLEPESFANIKILVNVPRDLDFEISVMPDNIIEVGPLVRAANPVREADPELANWLAQGPTLYINLGTLVDVPEESALEMARALRSFLDAASATKALQDLQVLWKLKKKGTYDTDTPKSRMFDVLGQELQDGRVRIVKWVEAEPISILESGRIMCFVNHGGANSFAEGITYSLLPQLKTNSDVGDTLTIATALVFHRLSCPLGPTATTLRTEPSTWALGNGEAGRRARSGPLKSLEQRCVKSCWMRRRANTRPRRRRWPRRSSGRGLEDRWLQSIYCKKSTRTHEGTGLRK
jgi:hypothetical protein